jgi:flagellar motor protein MotB
MKRVHSPIISNVEEASEEGSWAISYGDMITLLLSFFVIFFSADPEQDRVNGLNQHLAFNLSLPVIKLETQVMDNELEVLKTEEFKMKTTLVGENIVVTFDKVSFFRAGKVDITEEGLQTLSQFATHYLPYAANYHLAIKGFTDRTPVSEGRRFEDNLELSALRSIRGMRTLQKAGIPLSQMEIAGAGELKVLAEVIPDASKLSEEQIQTFSRTIVLVLKPIKKSEK